MVNRVRIPLPFGGFDAAPLDRETVSVVSPRARQVEVLLIKLIVTTGVARAMRQPPRLFIFPPVVPSISNLDLMTRSRGPPKKTRWKLEGLRLSGRIVTEPRCGTHITSA